jgi:uncharacterized membrane protein required for colicin V production
MGHVIADILFLVVGVGLVLVCAKRGFLKSAIHFLKTVLAFVFAYLFGSKLGQFLCDKFIAAPVREWVYGRLEGLYTQAASSVNAEAIASEFPDFLLSDEIKANLSAAEGSGEELLNTMTDSIATPAATVISNILGYIGVFVISLVLLWVAAIVLTKLVERITFLHRINTALGALLGLLIAVTLLFVAASVIKFISAESELYTGSVIVKFFGDSALLEKLKFLNIGNLLNK